MINIREAGISEIGEIVHTDCFVFKCSKEVVVDPAYTVERLTKLMITGSAVILNLEEDCVRIGGLAYVIAPDFFSGKVTAVELYWYTLPDKRGHGHLLIPAFEASAKSRGCERVAMIHLVDSMPDTLQRFYEKSGYHLTEQHFIKEV